MFFYVYDRVTGELVDVTVSIDTLNGYKPETVEVVTY